MSLRNISFSAVEKRELDSLVEDTASKIFWTQDSYSGKHAYEDSYYTVTQLAQADLGCSYIYGNVVGSTARVRRP